MIEIESLRFFEVFWGFGFFCLVLGVFCGFFFLFGFGVLGFFFPMDLFCPAIAILPFPTMLQHKVQEIQVTKSKIKSLIVSICSKGKKKAAKLLSTPYYESHMLLQICGWREQCVLSCILTKVNPAAPTSGHTTNCYAGWINE